MMGLVASVGLVISLSSKFGGSSLASTQRRGCVKIDSRRTETGQKGQEIKKLYYERKSSAYIHSIFRI